LSSPASERAADQVIRVGHREPSINALLPGVVSDDSPWTRRFNQNEELFVELDGEISVPSLPIHHDVRQPLPAAEYVESLLDVVGQLCRTAPGMLRDLTFTFHPADVLRAHFHRVYACEEGDWYLYMLNVDLAYRAAEHAAIARGTNDRTAAYRGRRVFLESLLVPVHAPADEIPSAFSVLQCFSQTWLGERGRGYFRQGIWIDQDLTRFFSKLFLPAGVRAYPFYPFVCRYRTLCEALIDLTPPARKSRLPFLRSALGFIAPALDRIERELRTAGFIEGMPFFGEMKGALPPEWGLFYRGLTLRAYLNADGNKEFAVESTDA
jgi:hypothetical protein